MISSGKGNGNSHGVKNLFFLSALISLSIYTACTQYDVTEHEVRQNLGSLDSLSFLGTDSLSALPVPIFDPSMGVWDARQGHFINSSAAILRLDAPGYDSSKEASLAKLFPSVSQATAAAPVTMEILPSINVIEAKAKQFNDGLYAALDLSYYRGIGDVFASHVSAVKALYQKLTNDSAKAFVAAGLSLSDSAVGGFNATLFEEFLTRFRSNEVAHKPIGFYTWNTELEKLFKFMRFFQHPFEWNGITADIVSALRGDASLASTLLKVDDFYSKLTNPLSFVSMAQFAKSGAEASQQGVMQIADSLSRPHKDEIALLPPSTSVETELFNDLFPMGIPPNADLMNELVKAIQNGMVDLTPKAGTGWYGRQVYALETFLLPSKGEEHSKLLLTENYKKRLLEAFKAIITTQRETHVRQLEYGDAGAALQISYSPALRVEPGCTYFLRTALAYAFLKEFLARSVGEATLRSLHGLTENGTRDKDLWSELDYMRGLYHGLYLVAAEDIGMKPSQSPASWPSGDDKLIAETWLAGWKGDPDLLVDARVSVPIFAGGDYTRMWGTLGIRLCRFHVSYATPPRARYAADQAWGQVDLSECDTAQYIIPILEFAEFELAGNRTLTRQEFRTVCDRYSTKEAIIKALEGR
jgi:hypothetical protein